ncbi:MAG: 16S rRNA processing protein RimM [Acidiphilium sp. 34-60-192]|nr:MAG: 16S rRNA processing protein RimM [Acidiphilium sp. 34-60-192]
MALRGRRSHRSRRPLLGPRRSCANARFPRAADPGRAEKESARTRRRARQSRRRLIWLVDERFPDPDGLASLKLRDEHGQPVTLTWISEGIARITLHKNGVPHAVTDRDGAARLTNTKLLLPRPDLPPPAEDEFYLADLIGITAYLTDGRKAGLVAAVHDYGAGASLELDNGTLIPFTRDAVPEIDLATSRITIVPPTEIIGEAQKADANPTKTGSAETELRA